MPTVADPDLLLGHLRRLLVLIWDAWQDGNPLAVRAVCQAFPVLWRSRRQRLILTASGDGTLWIRLHQDGDSYPVLRHWPGRRSS